MKVVIIGGGAAGISTATRLRRLNENAEILILEKSGEFAVSGCGLTYYLSGEVRREELIGASVEEMRELYNIEIRLNNEVTSINRRDKTVSIEGRGNETYDKLVIATGAYQLRPDIDGVLADNIFTVRNLETVERIKNYIKDIDAKNAVIVGGGMIGIDTAEAFVKMGLKPVIVEAEGHLMRPLDGDMAAVLHNYLREKGIGLYLNEKVTAFGDRDVLLASGIKIPYDLAVISTGIKPDLKLTVLAELELGKSGGLKVDKQMRTSDDDIFAAGDVVEVTNLITGREERLSNAETAVKQARVIAEVLAGKDAAFGKTINSTICKSFDLTIASVGATEETLRNNGISYKKIHRYGKSHAAYYPGAETILLKLLFSDKGQILGAQAIGKDGVDKRMDIILAYMTLKGKVGVLSNANTCYAPPFSTGRDMLGEAAAAAENLLSGQDKLIYPEDIDLENFNEEETILIDVRPHKKFLEGHIPHAINLPSEAIRNNLEVIPHEKRVILYCNRGRRSYLSARLLNNRGFDNIFILSGGTDLYNEILEDKQIRSESYERIVNM